MTEEEARPIYEQFCAQYGPDPKAKGAAQPDGSWLFIERQGPGSNGEYVGVIVRADERAFGFYGALGKVFRNCRSALGLPISNELVLGATGWGAIKPSTTV